MDKDMTETLRRHLFAKKDADIYAVLDGAAIPDLLDTLDDSKPLHACLFQNADNSRVIKATPYLVRLSPQSSFTEWLLVEYPGKHWGLLAMVPEQTPFIDLRNHFQQWLRVRLPDEKTALFRYYDPRVGNIFLPACNQRELQAFFRTVNSYVIGNTLKNENQAWFIEYSLNMGILQQQFVPADEKG